MAELKLGNIKPVGADNVVVESKYVKGGYVVVATIDERNALKGTNGENIVEGSLCYCQADDKFYIYTGTAWVDKEFGTTTEATTSTAGLMSAGDKQKLSSIASGAEVNVQVDWNETDTTSDAFIKNKPNVVLEGDSRLTDTRTPKAHSHGNIANDGKLTTAGAVVVTDADKNVVASTTITTTELGYLDGVTSNIQTQLNNKAATEHGTHVTAATVKSALGTGSGTSKYLREDGTWVIPPNTDTNTTYDLAAPASKTNGNVTINLTAGGSGSGTDSVTIKGANGTSVTTDANGVVIVTSATLATVATSGSYNDLTNKPTIPTTLPANGGNADTVDNKHAEDFVQSVKIGTTEYKSGSTVTLPAYPTTLKNPNALTIGGKSYDGSSAISVSAADLGIANALHFIGETTTALTDGTDIGAVIISGVSKTPVSGDVVLYGSKEFIWNGSAWKELGDGSSHALKTITISAGNGLTGGGDISTNRTLNVGAGNGITVTADAVAAKAGNGITVDSTGINHADTSSQASITASGRKYITGVTLDTYGHVTGLTTGTETITDTNQKIKTGSVTFGADDTVEFVAGTNVAVSGDATNKKITISSTDTGATSVEVTGTGNAVTAASYSASTRKLTLTKGTTYVTKTEVDALISSGTTDPSISTASQYYFKYN